MKNYLRNEFEKELLKNGISRRDAIKLMGLGGSILMPNESSHATSLSSSNAKGKIVIIGGGLAGISTAARLANSLINPDITIIEPNLHSVSYQAGNTFIAAGLYEKKDVMYNIKDFLPSDVIFIEDKAVEFNPKENNLLLSSGETINYDFLVVSAGVVLDFEKIKGLEDLKNIHTLDNISKINDVFSNSGVSTIYNIDGAILTWENMQKVMYEANKGKKLNAIFSHPHTAIKSSEAPKKIMYLMNARLNEISKETRQNVDMTFYSNRLKMFDVKEYEDAIIKQFKKRNMKYKLSHNLIEVNLKDKVAIFDKTWMEKGIYDKDLEEYDLIRKQKYVKVHFDFLHISPPMKASPEVANSQIGSKKGWVPVNKETLQHVKFENIFSLGDIAEIPLGKTGGSIRKQYKVLVDNLISVMEGKELTSKYDGYTVCPIITDIGKVMLAEFDWSMKPKPSFPLDPTQERYIWWLLKAYILKPMTQYGMLSGKA